MSQSPSEESEVCKDPVRWTGRTSSALRGCGAALLLACLPSTAETVRWMEALDRAVVAVRRGDGEALVSWRILGLDEPGIGFHLYRSRDGEAPERLNREPLRVSNFVDRGADRDDDLGYFVRPVSAGREGPASLTFTLAAGSRVEPAVRVPIRKAPGFGTHFVWVGDLDGDGRFDFVLDRLPREAGESSRVEAYTADGEFLWQLDLGPGSRDRDRYEPGPSAIDTGHWDGLTVYDFDGDGRAEVALRSADGVVFGDGSELSGLGRRGQAISIIDGLSGVERARAELPRDFVGDGPLAAHLGVAYLDGERPSVVAKLKNRRDDRGFNSMTVTWDFRADDSLTQRWKWVRGGTDAPDSHQIRVFDVDRDGRDEICDGGYVIDDDGKFLYKVGGEESGVIHGDRFHLGDFDPARPGLEGFIVQQNNANGLRYLLYDAASGEPLRAHSAEPADVGRGVVADIDPSAPGCEYWAFDGVHRIDTGELLSETNPWPNFRIWWDGDLLAETLNEGKIEKWNPGRGGSDRVFTIGSTRHGVGGSHAARGAPYFHGDILGDWREEVVAIDFEAGELIVCTTDHPTEVALPTLAHNPAYRLSMTVKGYVQDHHPDFFLGEGMEEPSRPSIRSTPRILQPGRGAELLGSVRTGPGGFLGGPVAVFGGTGSIAWARVNGAAGGRQRLVIRYANPASREVRGVLGVNGHEQPLRFPPGDDWQPLVVPVDLEPGATNLVGVRITDPATGFRIDAISEP